MINAAHIPLYTPGPPCQDTFPETSTAKQNAAEMMANTINVTIDPNDGLVLAITPRKPEAANSTPHQRSAVSITCMRQGPEIMT